MNTRPFVLFCLLFMFVAGSSRADDDNDFNWWDWFSGVTNPGATNLPPTITGVPAAAVNVGELYSFTPTASDPERSPLTFSISNLPSWASFNQLNGTLSGTPSTADAGLYQGIMISVFDGINTSSLGPISITVYTTGSATLSWAIPTTRTDGTSLSISEIDGFRIYMGESSSQLDLIMDLNSNSTTSYTVRDLVSGTYFFTVTTYDIDGNESAYSNIAGKTIL